MPEPPAQARVWKVAAPVVLALCGILLVTSAKTSGGTDFRGSDLLEMPDLVRAEERRVEVLAAQVEELSKDVESLTESRGDVETKQIQEEIDTIRPSVGMTPVEGPGLTVTLDDARQPRQQEVASGTNIEDYLVHQQDLEAVMNALWAGGAEAMMVMDQRVGATSTVRCVGPVLLVEGRKYAPPYQVHAIGDSDAMQAALDRSEAVAWYRAAADQLGLGYEVEAQETITMPEYESSLVSGSGS